MADDDEPTDTSKNPVIRRMLKNFALSKDAEADNRKRGLAALKFRRGGDDQWDGEVLTFFKGQGKPHESYNQIPQFIHQVTNDMRMNMPQTRIAAGDGGDDETAEVREDLCRAIQSTTEGEVAYDTAVDSQVTIGWGYWRYLTRYVNRKSRDQEIAVSWIPNPFQIYDDPNAMMQDFSDRKFLIHVEDMQREDFNNDYDRKYDADTLTGIGDSAKDWFGDNTVRVAEYWEIRTGKKKIYFDEDGNLTDDETEDSREADDPKVMWYKCTAEEVLEKREWPGIYIPYVRVSGETLYIDGKTVYSGLVEGMMSAQRQFNYWMNAATEMVALAPKAPFILDPAQIEGYQEFWDQANVKAYPFLPARMFNNGQAYPQIQRANNHADISSMMQLVQQAQQNFYNVTGIYPASLGQESNEKSGKAIIARQKEGDVSTFHYQDNLARALRFGGRVMDDLIPKIYDGSRTIQVLKEDRTSSQVKINQPHTDENGLGKNIDMAKGEYSVSVTTGPSYTTRKAEAADQAGQLIQSFPQIMQTAAGPELVRSMDLVNADMIADGLERSLPPQLQTPPDMKKLPPQVQQLAMQSQSQIQQLQQQLQQAQQIIQQGAQELQQAQGEAQNKQVDAQVKMADAQAKQQAAQLSAQIDMQKLGLQKQQMAQEFQFKEADIALQNRALDIEEFKLSLQVPLAQTDNEQAVIQQAMDQDHALHLKAVEVAHQQDMAAADQQHQANMAVLNSSLQPIDNGDNSENNSN